MSEFRAAAARGSWSVREPASPGGWSASKSARAWKRAGSERTRVSVSQRRQSPSEKEPPVFASPRDGARAERGTASGWGGESAGRESPLSQPAESAWPPETQRPASPAWPRRPSVRTTPAAAEGSLPREPWRCRASPTRARGSYLLAEPDSVRRRLPAGMSRSSVLFPEGQRTVTPSAVSRSPRPK